MAHPRDLARLPIAVDLRAISVAEGVRAALSVAVLVALNEWLHAPALLEAALAALFTCLCDPGGPIRRRVPALAVFAVAGAALTASFGLAHGLGVYLIPFASLAVFCAGYARVYGQAALQVGNLLIVDIVLAFDTRLPDIAAAGEIAAAFIAGSLWATVLTMVIWRLHPNRPSRVAVGHAFHAVAMLVGDLRALLRHPGPASEDWERHARAHRRYVRETIEAARTVLLDTARARGGTDWRIAQSVIRLEAIEQVFGTLIGLTDLIEAEAGARWRTDAARLLRLLRPLLYEMGRAIAGDGQARLAALEPRIAGLARIAGASDERLLHESAATIAERLRAAVAVGETLVDAARFSEPQIALNRWHRVIDPVLANFNRSSAILRHAARAAVVVAVGFAITMAWPGPYQHWLTITMVLTLQPYYAMTYQRVLERIGGTVIGGLLASVLAAFLHSPVAIAAALFPLAVLALSLRTASYGAFILFVTPMVVMLSELVEPGSSEWHIALMRTLFTMIGGGIGLAGCLLLWPSWEPSRLRQELETAVAAHGRYAEAELSLLLDEASEADVETRRRAAGMASNNLEASLTRALVEPRHRRQAEDLEAAIAVDAALRRMAGRLSAMQLDHSPHRTEDAPALRAWRDWIARAVGSPDAPTARPSTLPGNDVVAGGLKRIARQIDLVAGLRRG